MLCDPGFGFAGKRKTIVITTIHVVAMTAIGKLYEKNSVPMSTYRHLLNGIDKTEHARIPLDGKAHVRSSDLHVWQGWEWTKTRIGQRQRARRWRLLRLGLQTTRGPRVKLPPLQTIHSEREHTLGG
jgi:hypothetical protein